MKKGFLVLSFLLSSLYFTTNLTFAAVSSNSSKKVYFKNLTENQTISSPYKIQFGIEGMTIKNAGQSVDDKTAGHHHIIIDGSFIPEGQVIPSDEKHLHFGKGQTENEIKLSPGPHTITLQFADGNHKSYGEALSATVKVNVK